MRIIFMGTPPFAVPTLDRLCKEGYDVVGVVTQPDRPVGRKQILEAPPVKKSALLLGLPVFQFERIKRKASIKNLQDLKPDLLVTAAYGQILSKAILDLAPCINVHASLLPAYRGAAPIARALLNGEAQTGITTMFTDEGIDTGDILLQSITPIDKEENAEQLTLRLSLLGADLLIKTLKAYEQGTLKPFPQDEGQATYAPMLCKEEGELDFNQTAEALYNKGRALYPWPLCTAQMAGQVIKIESFGSEFLQKSPRHDPGTVVEASQKKGLWVAARDGLIEIKRLQLPGGKMMDSKDFLRGRQLPASRFEYKGDQTYAD